MSEPQMTWMSGNEGTNYFLVGEGQTSLLLIFNHFLWSLVKENEIGTFSRLFCHSICRQIIGFISLNLNR